MTENDLAHHLPGLLRDAGIESVEIYALVRRTAFRGGEVSGAAREITAAAREEHLRRQFGFWEYALAAGVDADHETRTGLIAAALRHHSDDRIAMGMAVDEFTASLVAGDFTNLPARTMVSLSSSVCATGRDGAWHLPMLDFGLHTVGPEHEAAATESLRNLGLGGLLFESGRSYHFIGNSLVSEPELWRFLARAQLLSPIIDARWVSHQVLDGQCSLRISTDTDRSQIPHKLVARVDV